MTTYRVQSAKDAQSAGFGDESYWDYLEASALEHHDYFMGQGLSDLATHMLTRSLSEALAGNDGD